MPADLDAALQPGETIVFRTRGRSNVGGIAYSAIFLVWLPLFIWLNVELGTPGQINRLDVVTVLYAVGGGALALLAVTFIANWWLRRTPDELAVTDRHLLFANGNLDNKLETMELCRIKRVAWTYIFGARSLTIEGSDGKTIRVDYLREIDAAARAIANAINVEAPAALGRLARIEPTQFGIVPTIFAAYLCIMILLGAPDLSAPGGPLDFQSRWSKTAFMLSAWAVAAPIGALVGGALALTVLRPFVPAGQLQAAICAGRKNRWDVRLALRWASLLYGRLLSYEPG